MDEAPQFDQKNRRRPFGRKVAVSLGLIVVLVGSGSVIAGLLYAMKEDAAKREFFLMPPMVRTLKLDRETVNEKFVGYGSARPISETSVSTEVSGRILKIPEALREGASVQAGEVLAQLDSLEYEQVAERLEALLRADTSAINELKVESEKLGELVETAKKEEFLAREEWNRVDGLYKDGLAAKKEFDFAHLAFQQATRVLQEYQMQEARLAPRMHRLKATLDARKAETARARLNVERCSIRAPYTGRLKQRLVDNGDWVSPGQALFTVVDTTIVEIVAQIPAAVYARVEPGTTIKATSESAPDVVWEGVLARKSPSVDEQTRTFAAYIEVDNTRQEHPCIPGSFVTVEVVGRVFRDAIVIPRGALRDQEVLIVENDQLKAVQVSIVRAVGERLVIESSIKENDHLVLNPAPHLVDGMTVRTNETK